MCPRRLYHLKLVFCIGPLSNSLSILWWRTADQGFCLRKIRSSPGVDIRMLPILFLFRNVFSPSRVSTLNLAAGGATEIHVTGRRLSWITGLRRQFSHIASPRRIRWFSSLWRTESDSLFCDLFPHFPEHRPICHQFPPNNNCKKIAKKKQSMQNTSSPTTPKKNMQRKKCNSKTVPPITMQKIIQSKQKQK